MQTANKPSVEELRNLATESESNSEILRLANHDPLPGPLFEAFGNAVINVCGVEVRPVVAYDWVIIKKLDSPLFKMSLEADKPKEERKEISFTDEEGFEICFQFTNHPKVCDKLLLKGREAFREAVMDEIGYKWNAVLVNKVVDAVVKQWTRAFVTAVKYGPGDTGDDGKVRGQARFFQEPPAQPQTD